MKPSRLIVTLACAAFVAVPAVRGQEPSCEILRATFDTVAEAPGSYVGNTYGDIKGAVSFRTITRQKNGAGETSIVAMTFVERGRRSTFAALLTAEDQPRPERGDVFRHAWGEMTKATGRFARGEGTLKLGGPMAGDRFNGELQVAVCR